MLKTIQTPNAPKPIGPYSQAIAVNGLLFCSGQVGVDSQGNIVENIEGQVHQVMKNISVVLAAGNSSFDHVVKTTIFLVNINDFPKVNEIYGSYFIHHKSAR